MNTKQCESWINSCARATEEKGWRDEEHSLGWVVLPRDHTPDEDMRRALVTKALAKTIFTKNVKYKVFSLKFYQKLMDKLRRSPKLQEYADQFVVVLKGSNAYKYLLSMLSQDNHEDVFHWSDTDLTIYINPSLPEVLFDEIRWFLHVNLVLTISEFKRGMDQMFFLKDAGKTSGFDYRFAEYNVVEEFKKDFQTELDALNDESGKFISPFRFSNNMQSEINRNKCSKNSFLLVASENELHKGSVVMVDMPYYPETSFSKFGLCPLVRTPLFGSYNQTIKFDRDGEGTNGEFELYRIRLNVMYDIKDSNRYDKITADLIDVSVPKQTDAELIDFWNHGSWVTVYEKVLGCQIIVPDIATCINELEKMLYVYESPEYKKEIRKKRLDILKTIV